MADVLSSIPGLGGYLAMQDRQRRNALGDLQGVMGLLSAVRQQQEAQLMPLKMEEMKARIAQAQSLATQRQREEALHQALPGIVESARAEDGAIDWGKVQSRLAATPGGLDAALRLRKADEDRALRADTQQQNHLLRQQQLNDRRIAEEREATNKAERDAARARYEQGLLEIRRDMAATRASSGQGGYKLEPFKFSVGGKNVQGWRDRFGNVFDSERRPVSGVTPEITSADQKAAQERAATLQADQVLSRNIDRMEELVSESPRTIAGPFSPVLNASRYAANAVIPGSVERPGREFEQLVEVSLNEAEKAGKLSNQQKNEIRSVFATGILGDPESVRKGIKLFRDYTGIRKAGASVPPARAVPGGSSVPPPPPGFTVD